MNRSEFDRWWTGYCAVFPETAAWINNLSRHDAGRQKGTIKQAWSQALQDVAIEDAEEVTRLMVAGDLPAIAAFDRERTAAIVRAASRNVRTKRLAKLAPPPKLSERPDFQRRPRNVASLGQMLVQARLMREAGATHEDVVSFVKAQTVTADDLRGPRFHCATCEDSAFVGVWSRDSILAVLMGEPLPKVYYREQNVRCGCSRGRFGDPKVWYEPQWFCRVRGGDVTSDRALAELTEWADAQRESSQGPRYDESEASLFQ